MGDYGDVYKQRPTRTIEEMLNAGWEDYDPEVDEFPRDGEGENPEADWIGFHPWDIRVGVEERLVQNVADLELWLEIHDVTPETFLWYDSFRWSEERTGFEWMKRWAVGVRTRARSVDAP